jgi:hypothetical protein
MRRRGGSMHGRKRGVKEAFGLLCFSFLVNIARSLETRCTICTSLLSPFLPLSLSLFDAHTIKACSPLCMTIERQPRPRDVPQPTREASNLLSLSIKRRPSSSRIAPPTLSALSSTSVTLPTNPYPLLSFSSRHLALHKASPLTTLLSGWRTSMTESTASSTRPTTLVFCRMCTSLSA